MRVSGFASAGEAPRRFSEVVAERRAMDPATRQRAAWADEIARLEGAALEASDPAAAKRLQCEAEEIRLRFTEQPGSR